MRQSSSETSIAIRADATVVMGTGHVMRMIALVQGILECNVTPLIITNELGKHLFYSHLPESLVIELLQEDRLQDDIELKKVLKQKGIKVIVFDGYQFEPSYIESARDIGYVVLFDDNNDKELPKVDLLINGGLGAEKLNYQCAQEYLLGVENYLLRKEFDSYLKPEQREVARVKAGRCLVTMGGSDPLNLTFLIAKHFASLSDHAIQLDLLVGAANPNAADIEAICKSSRYLHYIESTCNMANLLSGYDKVITAAGGTLYECAALGIKPLLVVVADNQLRAANAAQARWGWQFIRYKESAYFVKLVGKFLERSDCSSVVNSEQPVLLQSKARINLALDLLCRGMP